MLISIITLCLLHYITKPKACLLWFLPLAISSIAWAEEGIVVVTNPQNPVMALSREEVGDLFLGKRKSTQNVQFTPIDSSDDQLREAFYLSVTEMNSMRVKAYWSRIVFSGQGRPPKELSLNEVADDVLRQSDILVYLPKNKVTANMKVLYSSP